MSILNNTLNKNLINIFQQLLVLRAAIFVCVIGASWVAELYLDVELSLFKILLVIGFGFAVSLLSALHHKKQGDISPLALYLQLLFDALLLAAVVYFTGGSANPFIYYWLVLVAICAAIFNRRLTVLFTSITILLYSAMIYLDTAKHLGHSSSIFNLHLIGMWINFFGSALLITFFIGYLASALRERQELLAKIREDTLKNEQLVGIGTLAASTLHSLGTPLSSLAMLAEELEDTAGNSEQGARAKMMQNQVLRCKKTLAKLSQLADSQHFEELPKSLGELVEEIAEHYKVTSASPMPSFDIATKCQNVLIQHNLILNHALINLIDNAIRAAQSMVEVHIACQDDFVTLQISDDGEGIPKEIVQLWGKSTLSSQEKGMGIGVFLANSTIEKLGGSIKLHTEADESCGQLTAIMVQLPQINNNGQG